MSLFIQLIIGVHPSSSNRKKCCLLALCVLLLLSLLLFLILIPISLLIKDEQLNKTLSPITDDILIQTLEVDALWHWEVSITTTTDIMLYLTDELNTHHITSILSTTNLSTRIYALAESAISYKANSDIYFSVVRYGTNVNICVTNSCFINKADYYDINMTSLQPVNVTFDLVLLDSTYYTNNNNDVITCNVTSSESCLFPLDNIHIYYILAYVPSTAGTVVLDIDLLGRQSWYTLTLILIVPAIVIIIILALVFICC